MIVSTISSTRYIAISRSRNSPSADEWIVTRSTLPAHRDGDEPLSRETPRRFRATNPCTRRGPSGSIGLDPSDLPVLKTNVHVMFYIVKGVQLVDLNFPPLERRLFNRG